MQSTCVAAHFVKKKVDSLFWIRFVVTSNEVSRSTARHAVVVWSMKYNNPDDIVEEPFKIEC